MVEGTVADGSGARLPGVTVDLVPTTPNARVMVTATTDGDGAYRIAVARVGEYVVRFTLAGFATTEVAVRVVPGATATASATLQVGGLAELGVCRTSTIPTFNGR
jgi:hypothetical protein